MTGDILAVLNFLLSAIGALATVAALVFGIHVARRRGALRGPLPQVYFAQTRLTHKPLDVVYSLIDASNPTLTSASIGIRNPGPASMEEVVVTIILSKALGRCLDEKTGESPLSVGISHGLMPGWTHSINKAGPYYYLHDYFPVVHPQVNMQLVVPLLFETSTNREIEVPVTFKDASGTITAEVQISIPVSITIVAKNMPSQTFSIDLRAFEAKEPAELTHQWVASILSPWHSLRGWRFALRFLRPESLQGQRATLVIPTYQDRVLPATRKTPEIRFSEDTDKPHQYFAARWILGKASLRRFRTFSEPGSHRHA